MVYVDVDHDKSDDRDYQNDTSERHLTGPLPCGTLGERARYGRPGGGPGGEHGGTVVSGCPDECYAGRVLDNCAFFARLRQQGGIHTLG